MKKALLTIIPFISLTFSLSAQTLDLSWIDADAAAKARHHEARLKAMSSTVGNTYDLTFHRLLFWVDPAERFITGSVSSYFRHLSEPPHTLTFDMHDSLKITAIKYHGEIIEGTHENNVLSITLPKSFAFGAMDSIMVDYQGVPVDDTTGFGSFFTDVHGPDSVPVMYTLSEPYGAAYWWPCKQNLNDKIDSVHLVVTTPPEYRTASNGVLMECLECEDRRVAQWFHRHPIPAYLVAIAVTDYAIYSDYAPLESGDSIEVLNYVYPEELEDIRTKTPGIIEVFDVFNEHFGVYPYADEKYGHAQWNWGGGMEHQTMSFMGSFGHDLMAHELAHQWFGDYVTCGSWRDIWLNEGFATYLTGITYEHMFNGIYWYAFKDLSTKRIVSEPDGAVYCLDTLNNDRLFSARLSYSKGAMVLHQLRWELGDEAFFGGIRTYYDAHANGYALTTDLQQHLEAAADTSLQEYFDDWVYGEGYPIYAINYDQDQDGLVTFTVNQTSSHQSVDMFEMHIPIKFRGMNADTTMVFHNNERSQTFTCMPGFPVQELMFDPERNIISVEASISVGTNEIDLAGEIRVYPNPADNHIIVEFSGMNHQISDIGYRISDIKGKTLRGGPVCPPGDTNPTGDTNPPDNQHPSMIEINVSEFPAGIYFLTIEGEGFREVKKVIIK